MTSSPVHRLVIATHNAGKLREFRELLRPYVKDIVSAGDLGLPEPEETGTTFEENALLKARAAAKLSNSLALADDSGLCVNALGGDPGLYSARWALPGYEFSQSRSGRIPLPLREGLGEGLSPQRQASVFAESTPHPASPSRGEEKNFSLAIKRVQDELGDAPDRSAYFICVLALVWPGGREDIIEGRVDGQIIWPPRGDKGHGYDPVFVPNGETRAFAEMDDGEKNLISHRGIAMRALIHKLFK